MSRDHATTTRAAILLTIFAVALAATAYADLRPVLIGGPIVLDEGTTTNLGGISVAFNSVDTEYRVAWFDSRITGQNDIYAQIVDADGALLGNNVPIVQGANSQIDSSIAHNPAANEYLITWRNQGGPPGSQGFNHAFGGVASAAGSLITTPLDLSNAGLEPTLVYNPAANEYFLTARNFAGGGTSGIYGQRVSPAGAPVGGAILIATAGAPAPAGQVALNTIANQYLSTWRDQTAEDLKGRIINADGTFATMPFQISEVFPSSGLAASVAFDPQNDRYFVVFATFSGGNMYGQFLDGGGNPLGGRLTLLETTNTLQPFVAYDPVNEVYLLAWTDFGPSDLVLRLLDADGAPLGDPETVAMGSASGGPRIAANTVDGGFLVTWRGFGATTDALAQLVGVVDSVGDMNCDGFVDNEDIDPFVLAVTQGQAAYQAAWPNCNFFNGDINGDGFVDNEDIDPFVALITGP